MKTKYKKKKYLAVILIITLSVLSVSAKIAVAANNGDQEEQSDGFALLTISGAPEPIPALQYRLFPKLSELKPGNAAMDWFKLVAMIPTDDDIRTRLDLNEGDPDNMDLINMPFDKFKNEYLDYAEKYYKISNWDFLRHAALREECNWQDPFEDGISMLLPSLSDFKRVAKYIALEARVEIAKGNYETALRLLSYNYSLAKDLSKGKTLIQHLVGISIAYLSCNVIKDIISQPDSPNLYWALKLLPSPFIDMHMAYESEMELWLQSYVSDIDNILSVEQANKKYQDFYHDFSDLGDNTVPFTAFVAAGYVPAKKYLLENGYDSRKVDMMPASQVVLLWQWKEYLPLRDSVFKYLFVPYYQGKDQLEEVEKTVDDKRQEKIIPNIFFECLPALYKCSLQSARMQVKIDALQCVETIRMYVAENGTLPEKLSDLPVPLPINSFTGNKFKYYLDGDSAVLNFEDPQVKKDFYGYRIKLR